MFFSYEVWKNFKGYAYPRVLPEKKKNTACIQQRDETINSSLIETGRSLLDPQPHPSCTSSPNETDVHECLSSGRQKYGCHKRKDLGCTKDIEVFPSQISEACLSPDKS